MRKGCNCSSGDPIENQQLVCSSVQLSAYDFGFGLKNNAPFMSQSVIHNMNLWKVYINTTVSNNTDFIIIIALFIQHL